MDVMNEAEREWARHTPRTIGEWLGLLQAKSPIEEAERADAWLVMIADQDYGLVTFAGPFEDAIEAMKFADQRQQILDNETEPGHLGWKITVHPMARD